MIRDDYILRMIREFSQMLTHILGLNRARAHEQALGAIEDAYQRALKLDSALARKLAARDLVDLMALGDQTILARDRCLFLAALLQAEGAAHGKRGDEDGWFAAAVKALEVTLATFLRWDESDLPEYAPALADLRAELAAFVLPDETARLLITYFERAGQFARAEDVLFEAIEARLDASEWRQIGIDFYERLLGMSAAALLAGNLPRAEVEAGLVELREG